MKTTSISYGLLTMSLRASLVVALFLAGWLIYNKLPHQVAPSLQTSHAETALQIILRPSTDGAEALDIAVELYPVDIVAARREYSSERRAGKRFDDFVNERMNGRTPISSKLDKQGQAFVAVGAGNWWLHALLPGDENLEWRLPVTVAGSKQTVELTPQNVYTRTKSF